MGDCGIPRAIDAHEVIVRAARVPEHFNKARTRLRAAAFRPKAGTDDLSVMRKTHMGANACKAKAKEIQGSHYYGFAALRAGEIIELGATVQDSREGQFCGHAHIAQGQPAPGKDEPADPLLQQRYRGLAEAARLYLDPDVTAELWEGPEIL